MASPQEDYAYDDLVKYLEVAQTALDNYNAQYPDLSYSYVDPIDSSISSIQTALKQLEQTKIDESAYLEPEESDALVIGSVVKWDQKKKLERAHKRLQKAKDRFKDDLETVVALNQTNITAILLEIQSLTAEFTAGRIDKRYWHEQWVDKQREYYQAYHIKQCQKLFAAKDLDLEYINAVSDIPIDSGLYFLFHEGEIIYIGHSANLHKRLKNHTVVREYYRQRENGTYIIDCVYALLPIEEAQSTERALIEVAKPKTNKRGKG